MRNKEELAKSLAMIALVLVGSKYLGAFPCLIGYAAARVIYRKLRESHPNPSDILPMAVGLVVGVTVAFAASLALSQILQNMG